jgi:hypothetical protein
MPSRCCSARSAACCARCSPDAISKPDRRRPCWYASAIYTPRNPMHGEETGRLCRHEVSGRPRRPGHQRRTGRRRSLRRAARLFLRRRPHVHGHLEAHPHPGGAASNRAGHRRSLHDPRPLGARQVVRLVREAQNESRRAFTAPIQLASWLADVLSPVEGARLRRFLELPPA